MPLLPIFSKIAGLFKDQCNGKPRSELHTDLPSGVVRHGVKLVESQPVQLPNHESICYINGRSDLVVSFDDGSHGVKDFKASNTSRDSAWMYSRQPHVYAYALEHPTLG